jgi:hypothetical protein
MEHYKETERKSTFSGTGSQLTCEWQKNKGFKHDTSAFNNCFITTTEKLNQQIQKVHAILILQDAFPGNFPTTKIIPITEAQVRV